MVALRLAVLVTSQTTDIKYYFYFHLVLDIYFILCSADTTNIFTTPLYNDTTIPNALSVVLDQNVAPLYTGLAVIAHTW